MSRVGKISFVYLAYYVALSFLISFPGRGYAQSGGKQSKTASRADTAAPKLTTEQERGLRLLKAAEVESAGLQPDMHAFVLWRASYAYAKFDRKHAAKLSFDAFMATMRIEDAPENDSCRAPGSAGDVKSWIQQHVLEEMVHKDELKEVEHLLPHTTATVQTGTTAELVRYYESKKELMHAEELLSKLAESDRYPLSVAANLITALGAERSADRMSIFNQALNNFEYHAMGASFGGDDIGTFIERTWKNVPPGLVLEAISKVLEVTKERDSKSHYSMSSDKGSVVLTSDYDLRLFQLLPILKELDNDKAEALLRERTEVAEQLKAHPEGIQSLGHQNLSFYGAVGNGSGVVQQSYAQIQDRVDEVEKKAETDPEGALAAALTLPVHGALESSSPRCDALLGIAEKTAAKKLSASKSALDAFSTIQDQLTPQEIIGVDRLPALYLKIGDVDGAKRAVDILVKAAGKIYEKDTDADDPNKAFKGAWPSTDLWGKAIREAAKISPSLPEEVIAGLHDAEIATFEKVALASSLIGGSALDAPFFVSECTKNGSSYRVSSTR